MALITDPDLLADEATYTGTTEVYVDTSSKYIRLTQTGDLSTDGVTLKCLYSFLKEEWKNDPNSKNLAAFPFPMVPITDESFELVDGWDFFDDAGRYLIRTGGWTVKNTSGNVTQRWAGIISLGNIDSGGQVYYDAGLGRTNFQLTGAVNQAIQIYRDDNGNGNTAEGSDFDRRTQCDLYIREYQKLYDKATLSDIGVTTMDSIVYRFPLQNAPDLNIIETDANVASNSPYTLIDIRYFNTTFNRDVDSPGTARDFGVVIGADVFTGTDGASASSTTFTTAEGGIPATTYDGGTLRIHEGTDKGDHTITTASGTTVTVSVALTATESNLSFTLIPAAPTSASLQQIYTKIQYLLRQASDIDASSGTAVTGNVADELLTFVGSALTVGSTSHTNPEAGGSGVIIEGFGASDTNSLTFYDNTDTTRTYPFVAALTINFGANLQNDGASEYTIWYTYTHRVTGTDLAITSASGQTATLTSSSTNLTEIANGEQFLVSGFSNADNNGYYEATGAGTATSVAVKKADTGDPDFINETAGATVNLDMNPFGSTSAIIVDDNDTNDMTGSAATASVQKSFNYDGNVQGGRAASVDAQITAVAIGLATGQYVRATGTIAQSTSNSISLVAPLERNYANP